MITTTKNQRLIAFLPILFSWVCTTFIIKANNNDDHPKQKITPAEALKFEYFFYEGIRLKNIEKLDASYEMFRHCLEIDSTSSAALFELSSVYIYFNQPEKAVSPMKKAVLYAPDNHEYRNTLATLLFGLEMFGEAADEYEILVKIFPEKPELNFYLAETYSRMGETGKAIDTYDALENVMGMHEALSMEKYRLYTTLEQPEKALDELKKMAAKYPMESRYTTIIGDMFLQQNEVEQALQYYQKALEIDPESPYYPVSMANYYEKTGQSDSAKQQINTALVNERLDINTKLNIITRYIMQLQYSKQDIDGANGLFLTLLDQHPDESRLKLVYGDFLVMQDKFDEALFQFQLVTESEPENIQAWVQLLRLSNQRKEWDEMIRICKKCIEIFPDEFDFHLYLGIAHYQKKEYTSAIDAYLNAITLIPVENITAKANFFGQIGDTYFKLGQTDNAFKAYEEALKYNDKNIVVLNNYAYYLSLLKKDLPKAERMSALTIKMEPNNPTYLDTYAWIFFVQGNFTLAKLYIEQAISRDRTGSAELADHYGDILYMTGEKDKAVEQWEKAREAGKKTATIDKKIAEKTYFEATDDELFNETDEDSYAIQTDS